MAKEIICATCHEQGAPVKKTKGNIWLEILLWILFFPVGFCYSVYRLATREKVCRTCGSRELVPLGTARAQQILANR